MVDIAYQSGYFKNSRNVKLFHQSWQADLPYATVIIIHGVGEHSSRYEEFARYLASHNISVCTFDLQGYGRSEGRRGHVNSFHDFTNDVKLFIEFVKKNTPEAQRLFLLGHSLGALIVTRCCSLHADLPLVGMILSGPPFKLNVSIPVWWNRMAMFLGSLLPAITFQETSIRLNALTHDDGKIDEFRRDPHRHYHRSFKFIKEYFKAERTAFRDAATVSYPVLVVQGGDDDIVDVNKVKQFYHNITVEDKTLIIYPDMYHEVLNEIHRGRVFADISHWINRRL